MKKKILSFIAVATAVVTIFYFTVSPLTFIFTAPQPRQVVSTPNYEIPFGTGTPPILSGTSSDSFFSTTSLNFAGPTTSPGFGVRGPTSSPPTSQ